MLSTRVTPFIGTSRMKLRVKYVEYTRYPFLGTSFPCHQMVVTRLGIKYGANSHFQKQYFHRISKWCFCVWFYVKELKSIIAFRFCVLSWDDHDTIVFRVHENVFPLICLKKLRSFKSLDEIYFALICSFINYTLDIMSQSPITVSRRSD